MIAQLGGMIGGFFLCGRSRRADFHPAIDLHGVCRYDLTIQTAGERDGTGGFPGGSRTCHGDDRDLFIRRHSSFSIPKYSARIILALLTASANPLGFSVAVMAERSGGNLRSEGTANAEGSRASDPSARMDDLTEDLTNTPGANSTDPVRSGPPLGMVYAPEQPFMRLFEPQKALSVGTIFTDLYFPFRGRSVVKEAR